MTKPFDEQYEIDRDLAAMTTQLDKPLLAQAIFCKGSDWSKQYFDAKVEDRDKVIAELAVALDRIVAHDNRLPDFSDRPQTVLAYNALTHHADAIKRARGMTAQKKRGE